MRHFLCKTNGLEIFTHEYANEQNRPCPFWSFMNMRQLFKKFFYGHLVTVKSVETP